MTIYPALEKLLELVTEHDSLVASGAPYSLCEASMHKVSAAACEAAPELRSLLADVREREAVADAIHSCAVELIREMYEADGVCFGPDLKDEEFDAAQDIAYAEKIIAKHLGYTSPPSQQAVDVEGAAREIFGEQAEQASTTATQLSPERIAAIIRKHLVSPREGWVMVPKGLVELADDLTARVWVHDAARAGLKKYLAMIAASPPLAPTVGEK